MTDLVRTRYRKHRKVSWGAALVSALAVAAVLIPLASGARPATYTFTGNAAACVGQTTVTFDVTLTNSSKTQNLGSADLYAPANITVTGASIVSGGGSGTSTLSTYPNAVTTDPNDSTSTGRSLISLRNLTVSGGSTVVVHISADVSGTGTKSWYSIVKQSNSFNPGDLDLSNTFTNSDGNPSFAVSTCTLQFVTQPKDPWQKDTTRTPPVEVAVFAGTTKVAFSGTANLAVKAGSAGATTDWTGLGSGTYSSSTLSWTWAAAKPNLTAPSGGYNLVATVGSMTATSDSSATTTGDQPFQVVDLACNPGQTCSDFSQPNGNQTSGGVQFTNTLGTPVTVNFVPGGGPQACTPWNRASFTDPTTNQTLYFPGVTLNVTRGAGDTSTLKVTYLVRNSEWVLTNVSRGNQDIDFCVGAKHQAAALNGDGATPDPFTTKYGDDARWGCEDPLSTTCSDPQFWGVVPDVSNPNKVGSDPAVCARGTTNLPDPNNNNTVVTWRTWTHCIPTDWDYTPKGG